MATPRRINLPIPPRTKAGFGKLHRRRSPDILKVISTYTAETGLVLWEWNALHSELLALFVTVINPPSWLTGTEIWHAMATDSGQRKMLLEAAQPRFWEEPKHYKRIHWIIRTVDKISVYRNIAAHLPMSLEGEESTFLMPDDISTKRVHALRVLFMGMERVKFWQMIAEDLYMLNQYTRLVSYAVAFPDADFPSPRKPRLRSLPRLKKLELQVNRLTQKPVWHGLKRALKKIHAP